jgi:hypothetical protein
MLRKVVRISYWTCSRYTSSNSLLGDAIVTFFWLLEFRVTVSAFEPINKLVHGMETDMKAHRIAHVPKACDKLTYNVKQCSRIIKGEGGR